MENFVAIDLETANACRSSICQIGITEVINGKIQPSKVWLVRPKDNEYYYFNISIHGITPEQTENSPSFPEVWQEVAPYLEGKIVVAHNTTFDMYALRDAFDDYNMEYPTFDYFCTLRIARYIVKDCHSYALNVVLGHLGIKFEGHHKSNYDSLGCAKLLLKCLEIDKSTIEELEDKHHFHRGRFAINTFIPHLTFTVRKRKKLLDEKIKHSEPLDKESSSNEKKVCFTGYCLHDTKKYLLQWVRGVGAVSSDSVTPKTNMFVIGQQDYRLVFSGMSSKQKKFLLLIEKDIEEEKLSEKKILIRKRKRHRIFHKNKEVELLVDVERKGMFTLLASKSLSIYLKLKRVYFIIFALINKKKRNI